MSVSAAFSSSLPSDFQHKALTSHETGCIMRARYLFLLVYLLGSCFGEMKFCVFNLKGKTGGVIGGKNLLN